MWQKKQTKLLNEEIESFLSPISDTIDLYELIKNALTQSKSGPATKNSIGRPWPLLPLLVCEAISGQYEQALPIAAALQLLKAAGDVFDDIEDADSYESISYRYGAALATNTATTLLILAEKAIARLKKRGIEDHVIVVVMDIINSFFSIACIGQHLDLSIASNININEDSYLKITGMKSASQIECACQVGALLATDNQELINTLTIFGYNLGMASQITNDIQGITLGNDIINRKVTLPVIYAISQTEGDVHDKLKLAFRKESQYKPDPVEIRDLLFRTGAIHYSTIKMEYYKLQAQERISRASSIGANVEKLKKFLE